MMVFRQRQGHAHKIRVSNKARTRFRVLTTGCRLIEEAAKVEAFYQRARDRKQWGLIDALLAGSVKLSEAYEADMAGTLDEMIANISARDLDPLVTEWQKQGALPRYVTHIRKLIPDGKRFPVTLFTKAWVSKKIGDLHWTNSTKNRYRAALSQFARWLVERDVLESNIVRDVSGKTENDARDVWYTWGEGRTLIDKLEGEQQALEALMAGTGVEWQVCERLVRRDIDLKSRTVRAKGHKNAYRNRVVRITEAWTIPFIERHIKHMMPNARVFSLNHDRAIDEHHRVVKLLGLEDSTLHDWRHTYSENNYQAGMKLRAIKKQLGHAPNSTVLERHYQSREVDEGDYRLRATK
jgi:integrase